jgi:hypothetical protein
MMVMADDDENQYFDEMDEGITPLQPTTTTTNLDARTSSLRATAGATAQAMVE